MSDRKYRQRGYQDSPRERRPAQSGPGAPQAPKPPADRIETRLDKAERKALEGRAPSVPGFPRSDAVRAVRQRVHGRDRRRFPLQALRSGPSYVRAM